MRVGPVVVNSCSLVCVSDGRLSPVLSPVQAEWRQLELVKLGALRQVQGG